MPGAYHMTWGAISIPFFRGFRYISNSILRGLKNTFRLSQGLAQGDERDHMDHKVQLEIGKVSLGSERFPGRFFKRRVVGPADCMQIAEMGYGVSAVSSRESACK